MDRARPATGDEAALLGAIGEAPEDDAPRLVYADWLEERGDPDRAAFIRTQCRLAGVSPAEEEGGGFTERERGPASRLRHRFADLAPPEPDRFYFGLDFLSGHEPPFHRGLPHFISCQVSGDEWTAEETRRVAEELARLIETTTVRGLSLSGIPRDRLAELLAAPRLAELCGLSLRLHVSSEEWEEEYWSAFRLLAGSPPAPRPPPPRLYGHLPG